MVVDCGINVIPGKITNDPTIALCLSFLLFCVWSISTVQSRNMIGSMSGSNIFFKPLRFHH